MRYITDRIENGFAVLVNMTDDSVINVSVSELDGVREGDIFICNDGTYTREEKETADRKKSLAERFNKLKNKGLFPGKD